MSSIHFLEKSDELRVIIELSDEEKMMKQESPYTITLSLNEEENALLETLARERGIDVPAEALRSLLHDAINIYDALWEKTFAESQELLDKLADEAHADYLAGDVEDFDSANL